MKTFPHIVNHYLRYMQLHEVKGKYRFYQLTRNLFKCYAIKHQVASQPFYVPYDQWCFWKNYGPNNYYLEEMLPFADKVNQTLEHFTFIDLGADIGTVSALIKQHCDKLANIIAIEPNPSSFRLLQANHPLPHCTVNCAVSDFNGQCHFEFDEQAGSDHEGHINPKTHGKTEVVTLDTLIEQYQLSMANDIVIKIDVEGQERAVFRGARQTIQQANKVMVLLELHPETLQRDQLTPEMIFAEAELLRDFTWYVPLCDNQKVDRSTDFFQQFANQQYDVIGVAL